MAPWPIDQCTDAHDQALYESQSAMIRAISGACAAGRMTGPSLENCVAYIGDPASPKAVACFNDCVKPAMMSMIGDVLSDACLACPRAVVQCATKYCLPPCLADPLDPRCTQCLCTPRPDVPDPGDMGSCLYDLFRKCAGFMTTPEKVGCDAMALAGAGGGASATGGAAGAAGVASSAGASSSLGAAGNAGRAAGGAGAGVSGGAARAGSGG